MSVKPLIKERSPLNPTRAREIPVERKPTWIRIRPPKGDSYLKIKALLRERKLHTVCEEAHCPNVSECWAGGTATFMLGSDTCTRGCRFCAVKTSRTPPPLDPKEPEHIASSIEDLGLKYVVLTSVDRDDLKDGGAIHFAKTIDAIKVRSPRMIVEALVPDFQGNETAVEIVVDSGVDVYAHNIETVKSLQKRVRDPRAGYEQSLETLRYAKQYAKETSDRPFYTKSSIMLGLGESNTELEQAFQDLRAVGVDVLTLGQYLRPSVDHLPVEKFLSPKEFEDLDQLAKQYGFLYTASGPMVRSSYKAAEYFMQGVIQNQRKRGRHEI